MATHALRRTQALPARLLLVCTLFALAAPTGARATGMLTQLAGTSACVSEGGSGGNCADGKALLGAQGVAVTNKGLSLYVASGTSDGVAVFLRSGTGEVFQGVSTFGCVTDDGTGGECADGRALLGARDVALDPKSRHLYVASPASNAVAVFSVDKTGYLFQLEGTDGCVSLDSTGGECAMASALDGARAVAVGPKGKFVYVAARDDDAVVVFARDKKTGVLTQLPGVDGCVSQNTTGGQCADGRVLDFLTDVVVSPKGEAAYVASEGANAIVVFSRDKKTGVLTQREGTEGCVSEDGTGGQCVDGRGLAGVFGLAISKDGKFLYAASRDGNAVAAFARDKKTGVLTQLPGTDGCISEDGSGGECADGTHLTGALSVILPRDGKNAYVASNVSNAVAVFERDKKTGVLTQLAGTDACVSDTGSGGECADGTALVEAAALAITRNGRHVYAVSSTSDAISVFDRD